MSTQNWCGKVSPHKAHHFIPDADAENRPSSYAPLLCKGTVAIPPGVFYEEDEPVEDIRAIMNAAEAEDRTGLTKPPE